MYFMSCSILSNTNLTGRLSRIHSVQFEPKGKYCMAGINICIHTHCIDGYYPATLQVPDSFILFKKCHESTRIDVIPSTVAIPSIYREVSSQRICR